MSDGCPGCGNYWLHTQMAMFTGGIKSQQSCAKCGWRSEWQYSDATRLIDKTVSADGVPTKH